MRNEPATKADLQDLNDATKADLQNLKTEIVQALRTEISTQIDGLRTEMKQGFAALTVGIHDEPVEQLQRDVQDHEGRLQRLEAAG